MKTFVLIAFALLGSPVQADDSFGRVMGKPKWVYLYLDDRNAGDDKAAWFGNLANPSKTVIFVGNPLLPASEKVMGQLTGLKILVEEKKLPGVMQCPVLYYPVPISEQSIWTVFNIEVARCQ